MMWAYWAFTKTMSTSAYKNYEYKISVKYFWYEIM